MKNNQRSRTAEGAAVLRASHTLHDPAPVFSDPFAIKLTSPRWARIVGHRWLNALVTRFVYSALLSVKASVAVRSRYAEDKLEAAPSTVAASRFSAIGAHQISPAKAKNSVLKWSKTFQAVRNSSDISPHVPTVWRPCRACT